MIKNIKEIIKEIMQLNFICEEEDYIGPILEKRKEINFEDFNRR